MKIQRIADFFILIVISLPITIFAAATASAQTKSGGAQIQAVGARAVTPGDDGSASFEWPRVAADQANKHKVKVACEATECVEYQKCNIFETPQFCDWFGTAADWCHDSPPVHGACLCSTC